MDITGWTIDQRMRLPDWCFGNREVTGIYINRGTIGFTWRMGLIALPDPVCIWGVVVTSMPDANGVAYLRIGLSSTLPTSNAEMDGAIEIFPYAWRPQTGPKIITLYSGLFTVLGFDSRRGMSSEGAKLVVQLECKANIMVRVDVELIYSALPTGMAGWMAHSLI